MRQLIFTDLDGTLLDEASYSYAEAQPALSLIAAAKIPLIFCSSKTRAELEIYRSQLHNRHPFISENGGGIFIPQGYFSFAFDAVPAHGYQLLALGMPYAEIRNHFIRLRVQTGAKVRGFGDMTDAEVAALTGLPLSDAALARQRDFDEAFVFAGETERHFLRAIAEAGLNWTQGRIFHLMGKHDKGRAVNTLLAMYRQEFGEVRSIGLGDGLNDSPMLQVVDQAVLVKNSAGNFAIDIPNLLRTRLAGPAGWNQALQQLLFKDQDSIAQIISG